ncbi:Ig-specific serine endopeptidase MIP [Mycoplasma bradburyae]|uniref:DUF31 family protein n=1 Tax=Mycoplasma bradburyae TaxID=2963128 RepID=A0AAW6HP12_9MOLU|nr:DUF31 family protein [Mycoplasma bradburyae]MDC4183162.1 DUF31 family protein [Mycoplasma bradburyae]
MKKWTKYLALFLGSSIIVSSCKTEKSDDSTSNKSGESSDGSNKPNKPGTSSGSSSGSTDSQPTNPNDPNLYSLAANIDNIDTFIQPKNQWTNKVENNQREVADQYENYSAANNFVNYYLYNNRLTQKPSFWLKDRADRAHVSPFSLTKDQLKAINTKAKSIDQPLYQDAYAYGFNLPGINKQTKALDNSIDVVNDTNSTVSIPYYNKKGSNFAIKNTGKGWLIANDKYQQLSKITYSIRISNIISETEIKQDNSSHVSPNPATNTGNWSGTAWLLDYDLPTQTGKYPTTWYLASNFHVLQHLQLANDNQALIRNNKAKTSKIELFQLDQTRIQKGQEIKPEKSQGIYFKDPYLKVTEVDPNNVKTVVLGNDAIKQKTSTFTDDANYKAAQTLLDFGVIRVTFKSEEEARSVTNGYAEWSDADKFKPAKYSYLEDEKYKSLPANDLYAFGLPPSKGDGILDRRVYGNIENLRTPWINKSSRTDGVKEGGGDLSWTVTQRSFVNKPGVTDIFLTLPRIGGNNNFYRVNEQNFTHNGLGYLVDHYAVPPGGSGSPLVNSKNEIVGLIFAADDVINTGTALAIHSGGYDYQGYYGSYNLPKYDLIYGTGDDSQTKSYHQGLKLINPGQTVNTWLFH